MRTSFKYYYIYLFLTIFLMIGFVCGFLFCRSSRVEESFLNSFDSLSILNSNCSPFIKDFKFVGLIICSSFIFILAPYLLFKMFINSFSIGFVFNLLLGHGFLFSFIFCFFYFVIPFIFLIFLTRVGVIVSKNLFLFIIKKNKVLYLKKYLKKYLVLSIMLGIYELFLFLFSGFLNDFLLKLIK